MPLACLLRRLACCTAGSMAACCRRHVCMWLHVQDVGALVGLARRRCADGKAGVRKTAVHLLEALLLLRASGAGGADVILPSGPDIEAIQHAAADPMVPRIPTFQTTSNCP